MTAWSSGSVKCWHDDQELGSHPWWARNFAVQTLHGLNRVYNGFSIFAGFSEIYKIILYSPRKSFTRPVQRAKHLSGHVQWYWMQYYVFIKLNKIRGWLSLMDHDNSIESWSCRQVWFWYGLHAIPFLCDKDMFRSQLWTFKYSVTCSSVNDQVNVNWWKSKLTYFYNSYMTWHFAKRLQHLSLIGNHSLRSLKHRDKQELVMLTTIWKRPIQAVMWKHVTVTLWPMCINLLYVTLLHSIGVSWARDYSDSHLLPPCNNSV